MKKTIKIGEVGVDSGQLIIVDPCYLEGLVDPKTEFDDFAQDVYKCTIDGKLWQFTYGKKSSVPNVNPFPGSYDTVIPEYGKKPNDLYAEGIFVKTDIDPTPHIPDNEFSYRGICKKTLKDGFGQVDDAVAFNTGYGDGVYDVFAEIQNERVKKVWVKFF